MEEHLLGVGIHEIHDLNPFYPNEDCQQLQHGSSDLVPMPHPIAKRAVVEFSPGRELVRVGCKNLIGVRDNSLDGTVCESRRTPQVDRMNVDRG